MSEQELHDTIFELEKKLIRYKALLKCVGAYEKVDEKTKRLITPERIANRLALTCKSLSSRLETTLMTGHESFNIDYKEE